MLFIYLIICKAAIGNLANHKLSDKMISLKIPQKILDVAIHDTQFNVQESALNALKAFCKYEKSKKVNNNTFYSILFLLFQTVVFGK